MKAKKQIKKKFTIAIVVVMIFSFVFAKTVSAKTFLEAAGGTLMKPVLSFAMFIGDAIENALDKSLYDEVNRPWCTSSPLFDFSLKRIKTLRNDAIYSLSITAAGTYDRSKSFLYKDENLIEVDNLCRKLDRNVFTNDKIDVPDGAIYSPYEIFSNKIPLMDVNFISPHKYYCTYYIIDENWISQYYEVSENSETEVESASGALQKVVSSWYVALRNIAIVALLSVLLYLGIRIVISSSSAEKATYKQTLLDWFIALILVFSMHYIMSFALTMTENLSEILGNETNRLYKVPIYVSSQMTSWDKQLYIVTNLTGYVRLVAGIANSQKDTLVAVEYVIIYLILIAYTVMYTVIYLKRVIYMAFLTIIAPLTAVTYPFRRKGGPGGNAFAIWFKEYMANLLIQPIHLLLYTITVGSTMELAVEHPIYAIIVLACLIPAGKMFSEIFGIREPQYADTSRTMSSERRLARMTAHTARRVVGGAVRGIRMLGTGRYNIGKGGEGGSENANVKMMRDNSGTNETDSTDSVTVYSTNRSNNRKNSIFGTNYTDGRNQENNNDVNLSKKIKNVTLKNEKNTTARDKKTVSNSLISMAAGIVNENGENNITEILNLRDTGAKIKERDDINPAEILMNSNINASNIDFSEVLQSVYPDYEKSGITSMEEFKAAYEIERAGASREEAIAIYKIAQETGDIRGNSKLEESWRNELGKRLSKTKEMQQLMESQREKIIDKYKNMEKTSKSKNEYRGLSRKIEEISDEVERSRDSELKQIENMPIRYADNVISKVENYYDNLD